jgi:hypothetical protein
VCGLIQFWTTEIQVRISSMKSMPIKEIVIFFGETKLHEKINSTKSSTSANRLAQLLSPLDPSKNGRKTLKN